MLPIFVINLDRRPDRLRSIAANLDQIGLKANRIPAVDARTVTDEELNERVSLNGSFRSIKLDRGAGACVLSHLQAFDMFLSDSEAPAALILEDDAELADDLPMFIESIDWWPVGARLVKLETWGRKARLLGRVCAEPYRGRELRRIAVFVAGACGYIVSRESAHYLLNECRNVTYPMDHVLFDVRNCTIARSLRPIQVLPGLVCQPNKIVDSNLDEFREAAGSTRGLRRVLKNIKTIPHKFVTTGRMVVGEIEHCEMVFRSRVSIEPSINKPH